MCAPLAPRGSAACASIAATSSAQDSSHSPRTLDWPSFLVSGALITETIFSWPGVGRLTLIAIGNLDYPLLMGILSIGAAAVAIGNLISDLLYAALDPRIRL